MNKTDRHYTILAFLKGLAALLFFALLFLSRILNPEHRAALLFSRLLLLLLVLVLLVYLVLLIHGRKGKDKRKPILLSLGMVLGILSPYLDASGTFEQAFGQNTPLVAVLSLIIGIVCAIALLKMGNMPAHNPQEALDFLESSAGEALPLAALVELFEEMCLIPLKDGTGKVLLYEPGAADDGSYLIRLVRQTNTVREAYCHITMDLYFPLQDAQAQLDSTQRESLWSFALKEDFFSYVKASPPYLLFREELPLRVELSLRET